MEPVTALFILGLYKATEKIWEKAFDAAWGPVDEALKARFTRWAGKGKEAERKSAFEKAAAVARANTLRTAADPQQAKRILDALGGERDRRGAQALAEEAAKLMLFSAAPDVPRLAEICRHTLSFDALYAGETPPPPETVGAVLSDFLTDLREALLDQEPYHDLIEKDMRRTLSEILAELRPVPYDDEATYRAQMAEMYRQLEFVGIPELKERRPITVEDIFIHLHAEREIEIPDAYDEVARKLASGLTNVADLQALARFLTGGRSLVSGIGPARITGDRAPKELREPGGLGYSVVRESVNVSEALRGTKRLVVLGDPGAGKTTLLKYLTVICAEGRAGAELGLKADGAGSPLPVFIPLREFAAECAERNQDYCLLDYLYTHAHEHLMLNLPRGFFEEALEAGRCLVCLDGLDEVWTVGQRKAVTDEVRALAARFPRSRYIVTSRKVGYEEAPLDRRDFVHHTVLPLTGDDVREFVCKWYDARERDPVQRKQKADGLITTIEREPRIRTLAANPLLLTIIVLVHRIEAELPHERVKLYDKCVTALVDTWEEVKGLMIEEKQRPFYRQRRRLLERLAYKLHVQAEKPGQLQTTKGGDLELLLTRFLMENRRLGYAEDPNGAREEARAFVRLARGRTGLLVERGKGVFGFPHLTFQEYLAACDIENRCIHRGVDDIWEEIEHHLHDPHWQEVILLLLGSLSKYDEPPTLLVERILEAGREDKFEPVLHRHLYLAARALADRVAVADALHRQIVDNLIEIVRIAPRWERDDASSALSRLEGDCYVVESLLILVYDEQVDAMVRADWVEFLGRLGRAGEVAKAMLVLAHDERRAAWMRRLAASTLGQLGHTEEATEVLLALARDEQVYAGVRYLAASDLGKLGHAKEAIEILLALARDEQVYSGVRYDAASALSQLEHAEETVEILLALARDEQVDATVHYDVAFALRQLGCTEAAATTLLVLVRDPQVDADVRSAATYALGGLGSTDEKMLDGLLALARDPQVNAEARRAAAYNLGRLGSTDEKVLDGLLTLARDPQMDAEVRRDVASVLSQLGCTEEAIEILLALACDEQVDAGVRRDVTSVLSQLGCTQEATKILLTLAYDEQVYAWVRYETASALGRLGHAGEAAKVLLALAYDDQVNAKVRCDAASALSQLGRAEEAIKTLLALAYDEQVYARVRNEAASTLGQLGYAEEAAEVLMGLAHDEQMGAWVRYDAASTLCQLGRTEKATEILLTLARDPQVNAEVRSAAYESLKQLMGGATANSE
jgi:tetratricopeptide (TPR) repeat protein